MNLATLILAIYEVRTRRFCQYEVQIDHVSLVDHFGQKDIKNFNLPFGVQIAAVVCLGPVLLLHLPAVLVELLVVDRRLYLPDDLLGTRTGSVLCLCQLMHCCRVYVVDLATGANNGSARTLLGVDDCLCLCLRLGLGSLQGQTSDLIH